MTNKMSYFLKQKVWFFIAVFFMVVNIVIVVGIFWRKSHNHHERNQREENWSRFDSARSGTFHRGMRGGRFNGRHFSRTDFMARELNFSDEQKKKYEQINNEVESQKDSLFKNHEILKRMFNQALYSENSNPRYIDSLIKAIGVSSESYNRLRVEKANKIKALCTDEQKEKLSSLFSKEKFGNHNRGIGRRRH
jgi:Spy/CpxP family protein refolding chaperone